ncbi:hypothetical protein KBD08_02150 [Candidatus Babeliales bacterium]|nr:hypothetical protein [Candidatus Babeliales bacterium]
MNSKNYVLIFLVGIINIANYTYTKNTALTSTENSSNKPLLLEWHKTATDEYAEPHKDIKTVYSEPNDTFKDDFSFLSDDAIGYEDDGSDNEFDYYYENDQAKIAQANDQTYINVVTQKNSTTTPPNTIIKNLEIIGYLPNDVDTTSENKHLYGQPSEQSTVWGLPVCQHQMFIYNQKNQFVGIFWPHQNLFVTLNDGNAFLITKVRDEETQEISWGIATDPEIKNTIKYFKDFGLDPRDSYKAKLLVRTNENETLFGLQLPTIS